MMSARIQQFSDQIRGWIKSFLSPEAPAVTTHRLCINFQAKEVLLVHLNQLPDQLEVYLTEKIPYDNFDQLTEHLRDSIKKNALLEIPTHLLLSPDDYQLFLIESLPVKNEEIRDAINWRVRSLINFPIEEAVLDYFTLPPKKSSPNNPMIAAIVSRMSHLIRLIDVVRVCNLSITTIDIPELAMRNLTNLVEDDEKSTAFIYFYATVAILNITRQKTLYFTRHINLPKDTHSANVNFEPFTLDILRYFDYFQSMWRLPTPSRVFIASDCIDTAQIAKAFDSHLAVNAEVLSHPDKLLNKNKTTIASSYLLPIGCVLQEDKKNAQTKN